MQSEIRRVELPQFVVCERVYPAGLRLPRHAHDASSVSIVVGGSIDEAAEAGEHRGAAFSVVLKPRGVEHENRVGRDGARTLSIELRGDAGGRWAWFEEPEIVRAALALAAATPAALEACAFALLAEVTTARSSPQTAQPAWLNDILRTLEARFDEPLRFDALARDAGLHPVYLSRAFQRYTGRTMQQYVRALRLRQARRMLSASPRNIAAVAADCGFADSSHLTRTFSQHLGLTPRAFRGLARTSA